MSNSPREPLFNFEQLTNSNTTFDWLSRTNQMLLGMNSLYVADVAEGNGVCIIRNEGIAEINIEPGPAIGFTASNELTLKFNNNVDLITGVGGPSGSSPVTSNDEILIERISDSTTTRSLKRVKANSILPPTILHTHSFYSNITFQQDIILKDNTSGRFTNPGYTAKIKTGPSSSLLYKSRFASWAFDESNIDLGSSNNDYSIISSNVKPYFTTGLTESVFNFSTQKVLGPDLNTDGDDILPSVISFNFNVGEAPVDWADPSGVPSWPSTWKMKFSTDKAAFYHYNSSTSDNDQEIFTIQKLGLSDNIVNINGKIYISNIQDSSQFIASPDGIQNRVPLTSSGGLLDKKFTNRIKTSDFSDVLQVGSLVAVSVKTQGDSEYSLAIANGVGSSDVVGIVESLVAGTATVVLSGEFDLSNGTNLIPGSKYFLSQTDEGEYVEEGIYETGILKPVFIALTDTKGLLIPSSSALTTSIGSVTVNYGTAKEETLEIDSQNYPLKFVAGPNIEFDVTSNNEISIRVVDAAGSQDTFKTITVDGVGGTDGDVVITSTQPNDVLSLKSNTLRIYADDATKQITFEAPNAFNVFKFSGNTNEYSYVPDSTNDTMHFIAGSGINFTQNTDDSIIVSATIAGTVNASTIDFANPYSIIVSDSIGNGTELSLDGGETNSGYFDANWGQITSINVPVLNTSLPITYDPGNYEYTYDSIVYKHADNTYQEKHYDSYYLPDELAGFVIGRITPAVSFPSYTTTADNKISRLTRRDLRFFLGINPTGFIDNINNVYNTWTIQGGPDDGTMVEATNKSGEIIFEGGSGIEITDGSGGSGTPFIRITNTGVAQNAFSNINIKNHQDQIIDTIIANTSSDVFSLKSGAFVKLFSDTNNDTVTIDVSVPYDYALLGNAGTSDGMGIIDLSQDSSCLVGRAGGAIRSITDDDLKWGATHTTLPILPLPYFGMIQVNPGGSSKYLNASTNGLFKLTKGDNITFVVNETTNELTISATGTGTPSSSPSIKQIEIDSSTYIVNNTPGDNFFERLKFIGGSGISLLPSYSNVSGTVGMGIGLASIASNTVLANNQAITSAPRAVVLDKGQVLARLDGANIAGVDIRDLSTTSSTLRNALDIRHFNSVTYINGTEAGTFSSLPSTARNGASLTFEAGQNIVLGKTIVSGVDRLVLNSLTSLKTDSDPIFRSTEVPVGILTRVKYGNPQLNINDTNDKNLLFQELFGIYTGQTSLYILGKETKLDPDAGVSQTTVTSQIGSPNQLYQTNTNMFEYVYGTKYTLNVSDYNGSSWTVGDFELVADVVQISAEDEIRFIGGGSYVDFGSKYIQSDANQFKFSTASGSVTLGAFVNTNASANANMIFATAESVRLKLKPTVNPDDAYLQFTNDETNTNISNTRITSSGTIFFDTNVTISSGRTINFTGATVQGITVSNHASTHQFADSIASDPVSTPTASDYIEAWQVGAVSRSNPNMLNRIVISKQNGFFDFETTATTEELYGNGTTGNASTWSTIFDDDTITDANSGPMYVVLANGQETVLLDETAGNYKGPPGQIIMIRAE